MRRNTTFSSKDIIVEIPEIGEVKFWGSIKMVDNGIGSYEFWGSKGFDSQIEPEVQEVFWNKEEYTDEQNKIIDSYSESHSEEIDGQLIDGLDYSDFSEDSGSDPDEYYDRKREEERED